MILLKGFIIVLFMLYLYYRTGVLFKKLIHYEDNGIITTVLYGFVTYFSIFEIINIPFIFFYKSSIGTFYVLFIIISFLLPVLSYLINIKQNKYDVFTIIREHKECIKKIKLREYIYYIVAIVIIVFQIINSTFMFKQDADDSFYVSWANEAKNLENYYDTDPSTGMTNSKFNYIYFLNTWEIQNGFIARLFNINVTTLMHTIFQVLYIVLSYSAYYTLLKKLVKKENLGFSLLILAVVFLFSGVSVKFKGVFLLGRIHQGKSIFINIIVPLAMYKLLEFKNIQNKDILILINIYLSSMTFTPMTITLLSLLYGLFLTIILVKKDLKKFMKMLLILMPVLLIGVLYIIVTLMNSSTLTNNNIEDFNQFNEIVNFIDKGKILCIIYLISLYIVFLKGNEKQKEITLYLPLLMIILVFNPLLSTIYAKIINASTYWRLFWLIPFEITIVIGATIIFDTNKNTKHKTIYTFFVILILALSGKYLYIEERGFLKFETIEKIPQYIIDEAEYLSNNSDIKPLVIAPPEPWESTMLRQYSSKIKLVYSRSIYESINNIENELIELYKKIYYDNNEKYDLNTLNELEKYNIEWVIIPKTKELKLKDQCKYSIEFENNKNYILKIRSRHES